MKILTGLGAGFFWALDTVILGIALAQSPFSEMKHAALLAPLISTFLHDLCSCIWMLLRTGMKKQFGKVRAALRTRGGRFVILGALLGGPVGMTGYVFAIRCLGAAYTAMISSLFPALGALFAFLFLKEKLKMRQAAGLVLCLLAAVLLGMSGQSQQPENFALGLFSAILCTVGWAAEVTVCAYGMKNDSVDNEQALLIRQMTSALFYGIVILNLFRGWGEAVAVLQTPVTAVIAFAALFGTASYLAYYKTIHRLGASVGMALNITYSAWAILLELVIFGNIPEAGSVVCGAVLVAGALLAALRN